MLTNYDAKGIADVLGIAFQRDKETARAKPAAPPGAAKRRPAATGAAAGSDTFFAHRDGVRMIDPETVDWPVQPCPVKVAKRPDIANKTARDRRIQPPTAALIEWAVEHGLPRRALRHVAEKLAGGDKGRVASLEWSVVPRTTLERRTQHLSPQESERTERVARLFVHARRALGTEAEARMFMTMPHPLLDGRSPIDAARNDLGTRRTEQILYSLEYGLAL
jgi:putative toxin-antitoxin system antitoxin component (TIGR02293 family)